MKKATSKKKILKLKAKPKGKAKPALKAKAKPKAAAKAKPKPKPRAKAKAKPKAKILKRKAVASAVVPAPKTKTAAPPLQPRIPMPATPGSLDARGLALLAAQSAYDKKAFDVIVMDVAGKSPLADMMVVASARSSTHANSVADSVVQELAKAGYQVSKRERGPMRDTTWILLDYFDVLVHVLLTEQRAQYDLEHLYPGVKIIAQFH
jgi:ribosome-associated protein